jgi:hypothetical protein
MEEFHKLLATETIEQLLARTEKAVAGLGAEAVATFAALAGEVRRLAKVNEKMTGAFVRQKPERKQ